MANHIGLVSISFRKHSVEELIAAMRESRLTAVEWGGDVHVPHGDVKRAEEVKRLSGDLILPEYGSYYIIGQSDPALFDEVLASARALQTKRIRVWPGSGQPSDTLSDEQYRAYVADARRICDLAGDTELVMECHPQTLTDEYHMTLAFLSDIDRANMKMLWQPNQHRVLSYNIDSLYALEEYITSVHVFSWERKKRFPLADGADRWARYLEILRRKERCYLLEFMHDDRLESLPEAAQTLTSWLK